MLIDMKRAAEVNQRKGLTGRTVVAMTWFAFCLIFSFLFVNWLLASGTMDNAFVYGEVGVPTSVSMDVVRLVSTAMMFGALQFIAIIIFAMISPQARVRPGRPTATAQAPDFY